MNKFQFAVVLSASILFFSCKKVEKHIEKDYTYGVNDVEVQNNGSNKQTPKTTTEFISIAYSDLMGSTISSTELQNMNISYLAFGDKKLIEDMVVKNFMKKATGKIPTKAAMQADVSDFVIKSYKKFFNREPNEMELWSMVKMINDDPNITPEVVYYGMMTSNEYRYY